MKKVLLILMASMLLFGLMLSACSESEEAAQTPEPTTDKYGGILKILTGSGVINIGNPALGSPPFNPFVPAPAIESLMNRADDGSPVPFLLESWELDKNALTLTMYLREGIRFHDGTPLNAEAVVWNAQTLIDSGQGELPNVAKLEAVGEYTVKVTMSTWDILMVNYFVLKAGNMISPTAVKEKGAEWVMDNPVATGPFKFVSHERDVRLVYERNDDYWQEGKPYLDGVEWIFVADEMTRVASFKAGEAHVITALGAIQADNLVQTGKYDIATSPSQIFSLYPDSVNEDSPWSNVLVRQALAHAINGKEICDAFGHGYWEPTNQMGYPGYPAYNPNVKGYSYDPDKAKDLLNQAGYPDGFDTTIWHTSGATDDVFLAVQGYWEKVGVKADIEIVDFPRLLEISTKGWNNGIQTFLPPFVPVGYPPAKLITFSYSPGAIFATSIIHPNDIEELRIKALGADTTKEMDTITQEINRLLIDEYCVFIPIFITPNLGAKVKRLHDDRIYDTWQEQWHPADAWLESE